ncbi:MAG: anti-sigma factor [Pseudomonadota bacterium]
MADFIEKLSAYLDGELSEEEAAAVEARLEVDPDAQLAFDEMMSTEALVRDVFEEELQEPVPFAIAQSIKGATMPPAIGPKPRPLWMSLAAGLVLVGLGGFGGYTLHDRTAPLQTKGWIAQVADYHAVYASQGRHLVEVSAFESEHIEDWLGRTVGAEFSIPDLRKFDLTFEGARLLVANAKPVAQLMYRQADGTVIALCLLANEGATETAPTFASQTINGFDFVSWRADGAAYVVIGPEGEPDLDDIAAEAATLI